MDHVIPHIRSLLNLCLTPGLWQLLLCFLSCSVLMIYRLNAVEKNGFEGTLIGTLVMPYFSGFPNLCFAYLVLTGSQKSTLVMENCLVNNLTTLTLVLAIPCLLKGLDLLPSGRKSESTHKINHLSLLLSLFAVLFFSLTLLGLGKDGRINAQDGMILTGAFIFWQLYNIFDVFKNNTRLKKRFKKRVLIDFAIIGLCAWGVFSSIDLLLSWASEGAGSRIISSQYLGFYSGILMVLPNAFLAIYYTFARRSEITYASQIGDCHICIPLCIGLYAIFSPIPFKTDFQSSLMLIAGAALFHLILTAVIGRLPRWSGLILAGGYVFFLFKEII